jgi:hypothetical protein
MSENDELTQKQLKNLKRKMVSFIWETTPSKIIELAIICKLKPPKHLLDKYLSEDLDESS